MDEFLADIYETVEVGGDGASDVEKLAEAQILDNYFASEGHDVNDLDDETIIKVAYELFGEESALVKEAMEGGDAEGKPDVKDDEEEKEEEEEPMEEKAAQADWLGRVMAHSFHQESREIEKEAGAGQAVKNWGQLAAYGAKRGGQAVKGGAKSALESVKGVPKGLKGKAEAMKGSYTKGKELGAGSTGLGKRLHPSKMGGLKAVAKEHKKTVGGIGAGIAATGGAGAYAASKGKKKAASALDTFAEQRALEMLKEAGYETVSEEEKLAFAVEQRALEMLSEAGYPVE